MSASERASGSFWRREARAGFRRWRWVGLGLLVACYALFLARHFRPVASGADSAGYLNSANSLAEGRLVAPFRAIAEFRPDTPWPYTPLGFVGDEPLSVLKPTSVLRPTYPPGLPLHYALAAKLVGWEWGTTAVAILSTLAAVALCHGCFRELGVSPLLAWVGTIAFAASPLLLYMSFVPMSDVPATMWCTSVVYFALRARRSSSSAGWWALAGMAFSVALLVRPTNALLLPTLLLLLPTARSWFLAAVGVMPGVLFQAWYNHSVYGQVFSTGYGSILGAFRWEYFWPSFQNYLAAFPWVLPLGLVAVLVAGFLPWRSRMREMTALSVWVLGFLTFYSLYEFTHYTWWYLRFVLPAFPGLLMLALVGSEQVLSLARGRARILLLGAFSASMIALSLGTSVFWVRARMILYLGTDQLPYADASAWGNEHLPADALVACSQMSGALYYYTEYPIIRWDLLSPAESTALLDGLGRVRRPFYAALFGFEEEAAFKNLPGHWTKCATFRSTTWWRYDGRATHAATP